MFVANVNSYYNPTTYVNKSFLFIRENYRVLSSELAQDLRASFAKTRAGAQLLYFLYSVDRDG